MAQHSYGSIGKVNDDTLDVELLATPHVGNVNATGDEYGGIDVGGGSGGRRRGRRGAACALAAALGLVAVVRGLLSSSPFQTSTITPMNLLLMAAVVMIGIASMAVMFEDLLNILSYLFDKYRS
jgi:hypothetical protein